MDNPVVTLHRYYIWANKMRTHFYELLENKEKIKPERFDIEAVMYMSLWYASLYVVVEGWQELKLKDEKIDELLQSENIALLKRYRNGVFHFQKVYKDKRFDELDQKKEAVEWIVKLNKEFGRYFLQELSDKGAIPAVL